MISKSTYGILQDNWELLLPVRSSKISHYLFSALLFFSLVGLIGFSFAAIIAISYLSQYKKSQTQFLFLRPNSFFKLKPVHTSLKFQKSEFYPLCISLYFHGNGKNEIFNIWKWQISSDNWRKVKILMAN